MKTLKLQLLAATALVATGTAAQAQFSFPSAEVRGAGASAVADIQAKVNGCIGVNNGFADNSGRVNAVTYADFVPTSPTASNPTLVCSVDDVNGNVYNGTGTFSGKYVSTGSGFGRQIWRNFGFNFTGDASSNNGFTQGQGQPFNIANEWPNVQVAFSEAPASAGDITDYNQDDVENALFADGVTRDRDNSALAGAGKAIQIPFYIVPIAFGYNSQYGTKGGAPLFFNANFPQTINGVAAGGIRMTRADYCAIWNGQITNWNDPALRTRNGNQSLGDAADLERFNTEGVPIRLVGRADRTGTGDLFSRALAAQCGTTVPNGGVNKFERAAESLPFVSVAGGIDMRGIRSDTNYRPGVTSSTAFAGSTQSLNGWAYDRVNDRVCTSVEANVVGAGCPATTVDQNAVNSAAYFDLFNTGGAAAGLFMVADGNPGVEEAVRRQDRINTFLVSKLDASVQLNGKLGYLAGDFVAGSTGRTLHSAALQQNGTGSTYLMPSALQAAAAFGTVLPPQTSKSGTYVADTRLIFNDVTNPAAGTTVPDRANPLHWVNVLYPADAAAPTLAAPVKGYPVTGSSNLLTYTCFSDVAKRSAVANFIGLVLGQLKSKNAVGGTPPSNKLSSSTFGGTKTTLLGILPQSNVAALPSAWGKAVLATFLSNNTKQLLNGQSIGSRNLWIQAAQPKKASDIDGVGTDIASNPDCAGVPGA